MIETAHFQKVEITSHEQLREWLEENHAQYESVWLVTFKKNQGIQYVSRWEVLDEFICFGWIDGIRRKMDEKKTMQLISPRRVQHWTKSYKDRASKLIQEGRMHTSGLEAIRISKENGLWNFMDDVDNLLIPDDLEKALAKRLGATDFFENINASSKRNALRWVKLAKTPKTRNSRIEKIAHLSALGLKLSGS
jgi:uncharacterized protein YdeI (YjbR/CyaY-like superfamily)